MATNSAAVNAALRKKRQRIGEVIAMYARLAPDIAPKLERVLQLGIRNQTDPYGQRWTRPPKPATLKRRGDGYVPLIHTGRLLAQAFLFRPEGSNIRFRSGVDYLRFHISPPGRRTLPKPGLLPRPWARIIEREVERTLGRKVEEIGRA